MWAAGTLAAMSSLSYPAISAFISFNADSDKQGKLTVITSSKYFFVELTYWKLMILSFIVCDYKCVLDKV